MLKKEIKDTQRPPMFMDQQTYIIKKPIIMAELLNAGYRFSATIVKI